MVAQNAKKDDMTWFSLQKAIKISNLIWMSYMPAYTQKCQWVRTQHEKKNKKKKAKCEERRCQSKMCEFVDCRWTVKALLPDCCLSAATWVLAVEITKGKNDCSFHRVLDKFMAKTPSKGKLCRHFSHPVESSCHNKTWSWQHAQ